MATTSSKIKKSLKYSIYDGISTAVMDGMTSAFITPFAITLNASINLIAALTYIPQLAGSFIHLFVAQIVEVIKDRKKILFYSTLAHAVLWIPLLLIPYAGTDKKYLIVAIVALQTLFSDLIGPVWNSLMGDLVPKHERGRFFGFRNRVVGVTSFIAALVAGLILSRFSPRNPVIGFTILFVVAFLSRNISAVFKLMMYNPPYDPAHSEKFSITDFVKKMDKTNYGHFVIYIALFKFAVSIASPFFVVYMLRDLHLSYMQFTLLIAAELIASFIAMGFWGRLIDGAGTKNILYISGMLTPIIPLLWLFTKNFYFIALIQLFAGISWAGFNLSASNFIFDAVKPENRVRCVAYFKFFEGIAIFAGAACGGFLVSKFPQWIFISSIPFLFLISGILRLITSIVFLPTLHEARLIELGLGYTFFKKYLFIRPSEGMVYEVIGRYSKQEEGKHQPEIQQKQKQKTIPKDESKQDGGAYIRNLLRFTGKNITGKKQHQDTAGMDEIEKLTEDIVKGKNLK